MKKAINRLAGKGPNANRDPEQEAARALEEARRETAARLGGSRVDPTASLGGGPALTPPASARRAPAAPRSAPAAPTPPARDFLGAAPPPEVPGAGSFGGPASTFGTPPSAGGAATPSDERRSITDMALEDLHRQRQASAGGSPALVQPARIPEEEYERRRPPAPGESLPGVPPPHIPAEDLRDQALREILERKERLDREYRERQERQQAAAGLRPARSAPKSKLHGLAKKKPGRQPAPPAPAPSRAADPAPRADSPTTTTTTGESAEEALAMIKGVGPVIRSALLERFDSVEAIRQADPDELIAVDGIGPALASRIKTSL